MKSSTLDNLISKYREKADYHGFQAVLGDKKYRKYHEKEERKYNRLIIEIGELYLEEYAKPE